MKTQFSKPSRGVAVKIGVSRQVVIPKKLHDELGLAAGDYMEVELKQNRLILTPKALVEKRLAEGLEDIAKGKLHGPFSSVRQMVRSLESGARKARKKS